MPPSAMNEAPAINAAGGIRRLGPWSSTKRPKTGARKPDIQVPAVTAKAIVERSHPRSSKIRFWMPPITTCATPVAA